MKLLLDSCVPRALADELRAAGHEVEWVGDWSEDPGDDEILSHASANDQVLITLDKDFGELAIVHRVPHRGVLRVANFPVSADAGAATVSAVVLNALTQHGTDLARGAIVTAEPGRVRFRPPESSAASPDDARDHDTAD